MSPKHSVEKELSGAEASTTNNRMELMAAIKGLEALKFPSDVELFTDSEYLKNAFTERWLVKWVANGWKTADKKPVSNADLWKRLIDLSRLHTVQWQWVRGHGDSLENARVDALAVRARQELAARLAGQGS
jgi:ribonuclease HI